MTEQQNAQEFTKTPNVPNEEKRKDLLGLLLLAISAVLFIRFVPVSFIGVDVVASHQEVPPQQSKK